MEGMNLRKGCVLLFSGVFGIIFCWLSLEAVISWNQSKEICLLAVFLLAALWLVSMLTHKLSARLSKERERLFFRLCALAVLVLMGAGLFYAGTELSVYPGWDFGAVYQGAVEIAEDGAFSDSSNWYFTTYPNNVMLCMLLAGFFRLFGGLGSYITLGILLNIGLILLGMVFLFLLTEQLLGTRIAFLALLCCSLIPAFYMHAPIFYTDTFALPFVTGAFLSYQYRKKDARLLILTAAVLAVGYKVKGSLGVILIALLIHLWLQKEPAGKRLRESLLLVIPFLLLLGFLTVIPGKMSFFDTADAEKNEFPMEHWLAMGLAGNGGYNADVYWMTASVEGKAEKQKTDRQFIKDTLEEYGPAGLAAHLEEKILFTWADGVYFAPEKLKRDPLKETPLHSFVLYDGADYQKTYRYCNAVQLLLFLGILLSLAGNFLEKGGNREVQALQIAVFGLFCFLLFWETRSRYLVNFVPVFVVLGADGWTRGKLAVVQNKFFNK